MVSPKRVIKGDTFRFQSNRDHNLKNISKQKAQVLMVNYIDLVMDHLTKLAKNFIKQAVSTHRWWAFQYSSFKKALYARI